MRTTVGAFLIVPVFLLAACSTTPTQMRDSPRETDTLHVDQPYRQVQSNIMRAVEKCYDGGTVAWHFEPEAREVKPGELTSVNVYLKGMLGESKTVISIDVNRSGPGADVRYFIASGFSIFTRSWRPIIEGWATGKSMQCGRMEN